MEIEEILRNFTYGKETSIISKSEEKINNFAQTNFSSLILELSKILSNETKDKKIRICSSLIIKNTIKRYENESKLWSNLSDDFRLEIKNNIMVSLASQHKDIVKSSSSTIAGILNF